MTHTLIGLVAIAAFGAGKGELAEWLESDPGIYAGEYVCYRPDGQSRFVTSRIVLKQFPDGWKASYRSAIGMNGVETNSSNVELKGVTITGSEFSADPVAKPKVWNGHLPSAFSGKFVTIPPPKKSKAKPKYGIQMADKKFFIKREPPAR
jgi:hypothetical protein